MCSQKNTVCAALTSGQVKCWGENTEGNLGIGSTIHQGTSQDQMGDNLRAVNLPPGTIAVDVQCGTSHACARTVDGRGFCWGDNLFKNLGFGSNEINYGDGVGVEPMGDAFPPINVGPNTIAQIATNKRATCILTTTGKVKCYSYYDPGYETGESNYEGGTEPPDMNFGTVAGTTLIEDIYAPTGTSMCVVFPNRNAKCWMNNEDNQLGNQAITGMYIGDEPGQMGDSLPLHSANTIIRFVQHNSIPRMYAITGTEVYGQVAVWGNGYGDDANNPFYLASYGNIYTLASTKAPFASTCIWSADTNDIRCVGDFVFGFENISPPPKSYLAFTASLPFTSSLDNPIPDETAPSVGSIHTQCPYTTMHTIAPAPQAYYESDNFECYFTREGNVDCIGIGEVWAATGFQGCGGGFYGDHVRIGASCSIAIKIVYLYTDMNSNIAISEEGRVYAWGDSRRSKLGHQSGSESEPYTNYAKEVPSIGAGFTKAVIGFESACALHNTGYMLCWGGNIYGELGKDMIEQRCHLSETCMTKHVILPEKVVDIAPGESCNCALLESGAIRCWGYRRCYGYAEETSDIGTYEGSMASLTDMDIGLAPGETVLSLHATGFAICAHLNTKRVKCWGLSNMITYPYYYASSNMPYLLDGAQIQQLGGIPQLSQGCALLTSGEIKCWKDGFGLFVTIDQTEMAAQLSAIAYMFPSGAMLANSKIYTFGPQQPTATFKRTAPSNVGTVACVPCEGCQGGEFVSEMCQQFNPTTCACPVGYQCGPGGAQQCPQGSYSQTTAGVCNPCESTCTALGSFFKQDCSHFIGFGCERCTSAKTYPTEPLNPPIVAGRNHFCVIHYNPHFSAQDRVSCWGDNRRVQTGYPQENDKVGDDDFELNYGGCQIDVNKGDVIMIAAGEHHSCAVFAEGGGDMLKCWGDNSLGELGIPISETPLGYWTSVPAYVPFVNLHIETYLSETKPKIKQIVGGYYITCILLTDYTVKCWGSNSKGQLGLGIMDAYIDEPSKNPVNIGNNEGARKIVLIRETVCVLTFSGKIKCWGELLDTPGSFVGKDPADMGDNPALEVPLPSHPLDIKTQGHHLICAIYHGSHTRPTCWGRHIHPYDFNALPELHPPENIIMQASETHACGTFNDGWLYCWGTNTAGQLGDNTNTERAGFSQAQKPEGIDQHTTIAIATGASFTCIMLRDTKVETPQTKVYCTGDNTYGQLAQGPGSPAATAVFAEAHVFNVEQANEGTHIPFETVQTCEPCSTCPRTHVINQTCSLYQNMTVIPGYDTTCIPCPSGQIANAARDTCAVCNPGFDCNGNPPTPCEAGTYATNGVCNLDCAPGHYCPGDGTQNPCSDCAPGTYKTTECTASADTTCPACPADKYCDKTNQATPEDCPPQASTNALTGSDSINDCICAPGYRQCNGTHHTCILCEPNTYCTGDEVVRDCPHDKQTSHAGSDAISDCLCITGYYGHIDEHDCTICPFDNYCPFQSQDPVPCDPLSSTHSHTEGNTRPSDCTCDEGHFSSGPDTQACSICTIDTWCPGANVTNACPEGTSTGTATGSVELLDCNPVPGSYRNLTTNEQPIPCPVGYYCTGGLAQPARCPAHATTPAAGASQVQECICEPYYHGDCADACDGFCEPCPLGSYCPGDQAVVQCPPLLTTISLGQASESSECSCIPGYKGSHGGPCTICPTNSWCPGGLSSYDCPGTIGTYNSPAGSSTITNCSCNVGYQGPAGVACEICPEHNYCHGALGGDAVHSPQYACPDHAETAGTRKGDISACVCVNGYYTINGDDCIICPIDDYCYLENQHNCPTHANSPEQSSEPTHCVCNAGYEGEDGAPCNDCAVDNFCTGGKHFQACTANARTIVPKADEPTDCHCNAGYYGSHMRACMQCTPNHYCTGHLGSDSDPAACMADSSSPPASDEASDCRCNAGFYSPTGFGGLCIGCPEDNYCPGEEYGNTTLPCPEHSWSPSGRSAIGSCCCNLGYKGPNGGPCEPCAGDEICLGDCGGALQCPTNSLPQPGATSVADCECVAGYVGSIEDDLDTCGNCPYHSYCPGQNLGMKSPIPPLPPLLCPLLSNVM